MNINGQPLKVIRANPIHNGIRLVVFLSLFGGLILAFFLFRSLLNWLGSGSRLLDYSFVISCSAAIPAALAFTWVTEKILINVWPSGLALELGDNQFQLNLEGSHGIDSTTSDFPLIIQRSKRFNITRWYFRLGGYPRGGRERLVPDKWLCLACQLQQDDVRMIFFSYFSPDQGAELLESKNLSEPFFIITAIELYKEKRLGRLSGPSRPEIDAKLLSGANGRYWLAEKRRWEEGLELESSDFTYFMEYLEQSSFIKDIHLEYPSGGKT